MSRPPTVLVTAGSAGLGAAACRLFATNGYRVAFNYCHNSERASEHLKNLEDLSSLPQVEGAPCFLALKGDLGSRDMIRNLVQVTTSEFGYLDVVFSNGGWSKARGLQSVDDNAHEDEWDHAFNMNVKSHLWLFQACQKHLAESNGAFITTASTAGISVSGSSLAYGVTKAAQIQLTKSLAVMAGPNIRVNTVSPGFLMTDWSERFTEDQKEAHRQKTQLKRFVTVEDVAEQVLLFARSKSVTGVNAVVDAGFTTH